ncbi:MAG: hypothetical protein U5K77_01505 [Candidatus Saccharibacteria bacterium]|nr:hypothetical protein [Candidatus Saccharibacteria bacterium]
MENITEQPFDASLGETTVARHPGVFGRLGNLVCLPDNNEEYSTYREKRDMAWESTFDADGQAPHWVHDYRYEPADCPRLNKCGDCPNK